jgi:hypothetical protein
MGRRPLPERVLIKLPTGTLAAIAKRLNGETQAQFIRTAIEREINWRQPISASDFKRKPLRATQTTEPAQPAPVKKEPELTAEEKSKAFMAKMSGVTRTLPDSGPRSSIVLSKGPKPKR